MESRSAKPTSLPTYSLMRASADAAICGPTSLRTSRATGVFGCAASIMPINPPIEVPTKSTCSTLQRAINTDMSARYWAY